MAELATDSKRKDRTIRTKRFNRLALGEKGVGRIASFKLGRFVNLITRARATLNSRQRLTGTSFSNRVRISRILAFVSAELRTDNF